MPRLFQKPKLEPKEYLANLQNEIFETETRLVQVKENYGNESATFIAQFSTLKEEKQKELEALENTLRIKRAEREELSKPFNDRRSELEKWEKSLIEREAVCAEDRQKSFEKEREAEHKLEDVQDLSDQLGEIRVRQQVKEKLLLGRETGLKDREAAHMLKVERFSHEVNEAAARIQERENADLIKQLKIESKEQNLVQREEKLEKGCILLHDREGVLTRSWNELKSKQHGITKRAER